MPKMKIYELLVNEKLDEVIADEKKSRATEPARIKSLATNLIKNLKNIIESKDDDKSNSKKFMDLKKLILKTESQHITKHSDKVAFYQQLKIQALDAFNLRITKKLFSIFACCNSSQQVNLSDTNHKTIQNFISLFTTYKKRYQDLRDNFTKPYLYSPAWLEGLKSTTVFEESINNLTRMKNEPENHIISSLSIAIKYCKNQPYNSTLTLLDRFKSQLKKNLYRQLVTNKIAHPPFIEKILGKPCSVSNRPIISTDLFKEPSNKSKLENEPKPPPYSAAMLCRT